MILEDERHMAAQIPPQVSLADIGQHVPVNLAGAFIGGDEARHAAQQCGFSRPRLSHEGDHLPRINVKRDVFE